MYVYIKTERQLYTVGFYDPQGEWHAESDHDTKESAANRVAWLNGSREVEDVFGSWGEYQYFKKMH